MCIAASCPIRDFYHKSTVSLRDNNGGWQRIIRGYSFPRLRQSQQDSEFSRKGSGHNWIFGWETGIIQSGIVLKSLIWIIWKALVWIGGGKVFPGSAASRKRRDIPRSAPNSRYGYPRKMLLIIVVVNITTYLPKLDRLLKQTK